MNWTIIIIETVALVLIFTAAIMIPLIKNPVWWIHDYAWYGRHGQCISPETLSRDPFPLGNAIVEREEKILFCPFLNPLI